MSDYVPRMTTKHFFRFLFLASLFVPCCTTTAYNPRNTEEELILHVIAPMYRDYTSVGVLVHAMLAQTDSRWLLTIVSDGPDPLAEKLIRLHACTIPSSFVSAISNRDVDSRSDDNNRYYGLSTSDESVDHLYCDQRIKFLHTTMRAADGGHTPRAYGLESLTAPASPWLSWTVLSGIDNYYVPIFVESVLQVISSSDRPPGFIYWDFLLDRKGNEEYRDLVKRSHESELSRVASEKAAASGLAVLPIVVANDEVVALRFAEGDDLEALARAFVEEHGITDGGGCFEDSVCVIGMLKSSMLEELRRVNTQQMARANRTNDADALFVEEEVAAWERIPGRYEAFVAARLEIGSLDVGAFAFPTVLGKEVGYRWRHHSADWSFAQELLIYLASQKEDDGANTKNGIIDGFAAPYHIHRTLYVHN